MKFFSKPAALFITSFIMTCTGASAQATGPFNAVEELFAAMSAYNYHHMAEYATDDFQYLINGKIENMDDLIRETKKTEGVMARRNYFSIIDSRNHGNSVSLSFWYRSDLESADGEKMSLAWLESAVVVKDGDSWKIEMLHSTHLPNVNDIPRQVVMEEYVGDGAFKVAASGIVE
ncbi:MAG: nuclear transport factor 2 family protein [Kordiimonadaceae bacterium]|nr:nuclear transport factor 2 family protein [Kordiimonadaceae bacterium]